MYPETKFKTDRRATTGYSPNSIYNNLDQYFNSRNAGTSSGYEMSSTQDYRNKSFEYHEKYGGNAAGDSSNLLNKNNYGIPSKKSYAPQRKSLYTTPVSKTYSSHITSPKSYNANITSPTEGQKPKASLSAYNLIPKSLLNDDTKKPNSPKDTKTSTQNISKRNSIGQYPVSKMSHNKRNSVNYDNRRRSQSHPTKSKSDNVLQKPKLGVIGVLSAKKSLNEFSKRSSRVLNQQTEEINNLKARIQELTSDQEILRKLNEVSAEDTLLEFNDKYLTPLINKMSTYLMKFSSEYNEMIKFNSDFIDSQHDRTECLVELAANLNSQLHNFIEDFECDRFDERTYNDKRGQVDVIADTTSRLNSQLARVVLQLDDFRDSPDFQKENMTNSIQSLSVILQQLNRAAITVNQKITEYENTIQQKDEMFIRDQNSKEIEIDALKHKIRELTSALNQRLIANESEVQNREMETSNNESTKIVSNDALEKYKNDLVILNHNLSNVTLLFDTEIQQKSGLMKSQEQKINDLTERTAKLNTQLANITLLFDSEINIKNKIIKDKECQIEKLRKTTAELNHNLSVISLLSNEKDIANKRNVKDLMETISSLQTKWAAINSNLLTLTSTVNDQIRSKNEEIRLNRKDAVYYRDFSTQIYNQMMDYVGDFLQRIWNKNHENDILIEKNKNLIKYCTDLNGRIARFTLEINSLQNEKKMLMSRLADGTKVNSREISIQYPFVECREDTGLWWLFNKTQKVHEMQIQQPITECREDTGLWWLFSKEQVNDDQPSREIVSASDDDEKVEYYRNMAVDLNNRVAMLSLDIDSLKLNKYNEKEFSGEYKEIIEDKSTINFFKNQAVSLNSNLAKLTLEHNDFKNQELINKEKLIRNSEDKIEYYQQMAANLNTRLALLSLEMNNVTEDRNVTITDDEQSQYYENLIQSLTIKINDLLIENEELKAQQSEIQYTRDIPQNEVPINVVKDDSEINRFREIAVDLNSRLAKLSLEFNEKPKSVKNNNDEYIKKIQDQVIDLNQRLSVLTLNSNEEIKNLKRKLSQKEQGSFKNQVIDLNQRLSVLTLNSNEEIKNLKRKLSQKEQGSFKNQVIDLNQRLAILTLSTNDEVNALKRKISQMQNNETSRKVSYEQSIVECRSDTGLWWLFSKPQTKQIKKNIIYNNERNIQNFQNEAINLNQRLAVLTLSSNDEINNLKKQLSEKDILIEELRSKLASMNRQIIDLTFNSNIENQQNKESTQRTIQIIDTPKSENIIQPLIKLPLAVDYLFEKPTTSSKSDNIIQPLIKLPLAVDYLFEQPKIGEILREVIPINDSTLIEELNNERIKNKELNIIIESMRKEMQSISEYLKETKSCATSLQNLNNAPTTTDNAEEIASLAEYLKETKISLEAYKNNSISEINSLAAYLKDTISMVKEYKANNPDCLDVYGNFNSMDDTFDKYENEKKYDSEETVENQQFGY